MDLWPHRAAAPSPASAQKQRLSPARAPSGALLLLPDVMGASVSCILLRTPERGATGTSGGLMLGHGAGASHRMHPPRVPLRCTPRAQLRLARAGLVPALGTGTTQLPLPTGIPARWGCSPATAALGRLVSARPLFLFIPPPSHQSEAGCRSPVLSLQHWGGIGGDLRVLTPTAFITPSPFLRKEISHEPQWKSQRSTKGVEFRV